MLDLESLHDRGMFGDQGAGRVWWRVSIPVNLRVSVINLPCFIEVILFSLEAKEDIWKAIGQALLLVLLQGD